MLQDQKGYMWFAGDMGLSMFDGYEFKNYSTENGLTNNCITIIEEDYKGRIWFMTFTSELGYFFDGKINIVPASKKLNSFKSRGNLGTSLYVDSGDTIWVGTWLGLLKIEPEWENSDVHVIHLNKSGAFIFEFNDKKFVFGSEALIEDSFSVSVYHTKLFKYKINLLPNFSQRNIVGALPDSSWIITSFENLIHFNSKGIIASKNEGDYIISLKHGKNGLFVGTYNGLRYYEKNSFKKSGTIPRLDNKSITAIITDHEGGIWYGTDGQGVFYLPYPNLLYYNIEDGLSESRITANTQFNSSVVLGHQNSIISILHNNKINHYQINNKNISVHNSIISLLPYNKKEFIVVSTTGIYKMNLEGEVLSDLYKPKTGIKKLVKSRDSGYWLVAYVNLIKLDANFKKTKDIRIKTYTDNLFEDSNNNLWICGIDGLRLYSPEKGMQKMSTVNDLFSARVLDIVESGNGDLLMATRGSGVLVKSGDSVYTLGKSQGLLSNMCNSIFKESNDTIWVGTNKGLNRVIRTSKYNYQINSFTMENGLLSYEVNSIMKINGKLWFIHNNGITIMDPTKITSNISPPPIFIVNTLINTDTLIYDSTCVYDFSYYQKELEISFIGITYKNAGKTKYKYKMFGLDSSWNYTKNANIKYQNIQPGTYRFSVYASNNDGYWSTSPASLRFVINKAWWQTWFFYLLVAVSCLILVSYIFRVRLQVLKKRNNEESARQRSIESSELKALRAQMNPHFIFNSLNSIQRFIMINDQDKAERYLGKFSKLIRNILEQSSEKWISLEEEIQTVNLYLELESLRYNFEYSIHISSDIDMSKTVVLPMILQPYLENAIWHGLMHKDGKKKLDIHIVKIKNNILEFIIEDNGIGRKRALELRTTNSPRRKSMGMEITLNRINLSNNSNTKKYSVEITDRIDDYNQSFGTKVSLLLYES